MIKTSYYPEGLEAVEEIMVAPVEKALELPYHKGVDSVVAEVGFELAA